MKLPLCRPFPVLLGLSRHAPHLLAAMLIAAIWAGLWLGMAATAHAQDNLAALGYVIDSGDTIHLEVYEEPDLNGDYPVTANGMVILPLVGPVGIAGLAPEPARLRITDAYDQGFLRNPVITLDVVRFRPVSILGEINRPGEYPFTPGMTVLNAAALGGGFTYRADQDDIRILRGPARNRQQFQATTTSPILPGDIIEITERFF